MSAATNAFSLRCRPLFASYDMPYSYLFVTQFGISTLPLGFVASWIDTPSQSEAFLAQSMSCLSVISDASGFSLFNAAIPCLEDLKSM